MTDWDLQPRSSTCSACGQPFADKSRYHTLLSYAAGTYTRRDLCAACYAQADRTNVVSYWQGEYKAPAPPSLEPIQKDSAESLLRKLLASTDPAQAAARYILAVMLERKRVLKHRDTIRTDQGTDVLIYEHRLTGESMQIPDPQLRMEQLEEVRQQLLVLLAAPSTPASSTAGSVTDPAVAAATRTPVN